MINTQLKTCKLIIYVYVIGNILSQVIFFWWGWNFNVLLMKLKQKKNTNYLR